jgi:hypothetical protein
MFTAQPTKSFIERIVCMEHIHEKSGKCYEVGIMNDFDGKTFDMCIITCWDPNYEESPVLIDYYFGEYDKETTDFFIDRFVENQNQLRKSVKRLSDELLVNREVMESDDIQDLEKTIESVTNMISNLC